MSDHVLAKKTLADGRIVELIKMIYNYRLYVSLPERYGSSYDDCWCYQEFASAGAAFASWDGEGEPIGWNKHPASGRWRKDGTPESEINQRTHVGPWS